MFRHVSFGTVLDCYVHFAVIPRASRTYIVYYMGRYLEKLVGSFFEVIDVTRFVKEESLPLHSKGGQYMGILFIFQYLYMYISGVDTNKLNRTNYPI